MKISILVFTLGILFAPHFSSAIELRTHSGAAVDGLNVSLSPSLPFHEGEAQTVLPMEGASLSPIMRFFRMGDGRIHIRNAHSGVQADVQLLRQDGTLDETALKTVDSIFGFSPVEDGEHVSLRLLFLLDHFSDRIAPGKVVHLQSGYRDPEYNQDLRRMGRNVALTSTHMDAMALDFYIDGVEGKHLWEEIRKEECCGVGHYGGKSIHLDSTRPRFWEAATSKVSSGESGLNRRIYLSTQYDRYRAGEILHLSLVSVSDFSFGVEPVITILREGEANQDVPLLRPSTPADSRCIPIQDRKGARSLRAVLPDYLSPGLYRIRVGFCNRPSPQMPLEIESNLIEIASK